MGCYPSEGARIEDLLCQHTQQVGETKGLQNENLNFVIYLQNLWFSTQCLMPYGSKGTQQSAFIAPSFGTRHGNPLNDQLSDYSGAEDYELML